MPSPVRSTMSIPGRTRLVAVAAFCHLAEFAIVKKSGAWRNGTPSRFDRWALNGIHRLILAQIARMRQAAPATEAHAGSDRSHAGVHNADVVLSASDPAWQAEAAREVEAIRQALGDGATVHHIGSTAVARLAAKPIIDLAVALPAMRFAEELSRTAATLGQLGYRYVGVRGGYFFEKGPAPIRTHALQVHASDSSVLADLLRFRDALRKDDSLRKDYALTKAALAAHFPQQRFFYFVYKFHWIAEWQWHDNRAGGWAEWLAAFKRTQTCLRRSGAPRSEPGRQ